MEVTKAYIKKEKAVRKNEQPLVIQPGMLIILNG